MCCVRHAMYGLVFVVNFAVALFRICIMKSKVEICYQMCDHTKKTRGSALPLPLHLRTSGHAALSGPVSLAAATAHSQRGKCKLPASPANKK